jgi:putative transposase
MVKLATSEKQHNILLETMHRFNEACNHIAEIAYSIKSANKIKLQQIVYREIRNKFGLSAQHAIRAIAKVAEAYKRDKSIKPEFSPDGAIVYDQRILSWKGLEAVSILSLNGRLKVPVRIGEYQQVRMNSRVRGQADLVLRNGTFYLAVVVEAPEPSKFDTVDTLGINMGVVNIATDSDGGNFSGEQTDKTRKRYARFRAGLQKAGTRSAKRHLQKISGREKKRNRPNRDTFRCVQCGYTGSADYVGAINIAYKGEVIRPIVSRMFFDLNHVLPQLQGSGI